MGQINNTKVYCSKCCSDISNRKSVVKDHEGNVFCDRWCRKDWFQEERKERDCRISEWYRK